MKKIAVVVFLAGATIAAIAAAIGAPAALCAGARWLAIAGLVLYAWERKSLTPWIVAAMFLGAEVGHDWPEWSGNLQVLSQIFLRLIKTVIGPLLFATLVVGIAGHADLKKVDRKSTRLN